MSWQTYVDVNLVGSGKVTKAAILGQQGGVWATSAKFDLSPEEQKVLLTAFTKHEQTLSSGLRLAGQKYFAISVDPSLIQLKKGGDGAVIAKTKQAIIVAAYELPLQAGEATPIVEGVADYLKNAGY